MSFVFSFILHPSCIIFYPCSYLIFFPSFLLLHLPIRDKKGENIPVCFVISIWLVHILKGRNSTSCTFVGGESHRGDAYTKGEKTFLLWENLVLFCFTLCLFSRCFMVLSVMFRIYALLLSSHHAYVLDMHISLCYCVLLVACSDDHLLCYMIIVVISIWLFCVWSSYSYISQHVYLIVCLLVTLYLSFYHLIYLEGLIRFVQVFQVTSILFQVHHNF